MARSLRGSVRIVPAGEHKVNELATERGYQSLLT
jgi:hypothetical protein